jgi:hypothetical protein
MGDVFPAEDVIDKLSIAGVTWYCFKLLKIDIMATEAHGKNQ